MRLSEAVAFRWGFLVWYDVTNFAATSALSDTSSGVHISIVALCDNTHPYNNVEAVRIVSVVRWLWLWWSPRE